MTIERIKVKRVDVICPGQIITGAVVDEKGLSSVDMQVHHVGDNGKKIIIGFAGDNLNAGITSEDVLWAGGEVNLGRMGTVIIPGSLTTDSER